MKMAPNEFISWGSSVLNDNKVFEFESSDVSSVQHLLFSRDIVTPSEFSTSLWLQLHTLLSLFISQNINSVAKLKFDNISSDDNADTKYLFNDFFTKQT